MYFIKDITNFVSIFCKLAAEDVFVYTYVPHKAIDYIRQKGLLSPKEIIKDKKALQFARPGKTEEFIKKTKKEMNDPEWEKYMGGVSTFFTLPDFSKIDKKHNIFKFELTPIRINLSQLVEDEPETKLFGVELELYNPKVDSQPNREKILSLKKIKDYISQSPEQIWKDYSYAPGHMASDVPHLIIATPSGKISAKYIVS